MIIGGLHKLSLIDFPDKVSAVVFTYGCNFDCSYCHNTLMKKGLPKESDELIIGQISQEELFSFLKERQNFLEGVCISGGEPTLHQDLADFIKKIRSLGFKIKLDTNGTNPVVLKDLISQGLLDYVAMDVKAPLNYQSYQRVTQREITTFLPLVRQSIKILINSPIDYEFRTTVDKKVLGVEEVLAIANDIRGAKRYYLQNVVRHQELIAEIIAWPAEELRNLADKITSQQIPCLIRNI